MSEAQVFPGRFRFVGTARGDELHEEEPVSNTELIYLSGDNSGGLEIKRNSLHPLISRIKTKFSGEYIRS